MRKIYVSNKSDIEVAVPVTLTAVNVSEVIHVGFLPQEMEVVDIESTYYYQPDFYRDCCPVYKVVLVMFVLLAVGIYYTILKK